MFYESKGKRLVEEGESPEAKKQRGPSGPSEGSSSKEILQALKTAPISKQKETEPEDKSELTILDKISWILQYNSKSCVAAAVANNKLLIAENHISETTGLKSSHAGMTYIHDILHYFITMCQKSDFDQYPAMLERIFNIKFAGEEEGLYKSANAYKSQILEKLQEIRSIYNSKEKRKETIAIKENELRKLMAHSHQKVLGAFELGLKIIRRIHKIEKFLTKNKEKRLSQIFASVNPEDGLVRRYEQGITSSESSEQPSDQLPNPGEGNRAWINDAGIQGIAILATNENGVHAEMKILDFLLLTKAMSNEQIPENITIGLSKQCCLDCHDVIIVTNEAIEQLTLPGIKKINVSGAHLRGFAQWSEHQPIFLQIDVESTYTNKAEMQAYLAQNRELIEDIAIKYQIKHQKLKLREYEQDKYDRNHKWPKLPEDSQERHNTMRKFFEEHVATDEIVVYPGAEEEYYYMGYNRRSRESTIEKVDEKIESMDKTMKNGILQHAKIKLGYSPNPEDIKEGMSQYSSGSSVPSQENNDEKYQPSHLLEEARTKLALAYQSLLKTPSLLDHSSIGTIHELQLVVQELTQFVSNKEQNELSPKQHKSQ